MKEALLRFVSDVDPNFDRVSTVGWMRDAFRKEFHLERGRLEAFDQLGRPQVRPTDEPRRTSVVDLQIPDAGAPDPSVAHTPLDASDRPCRGGRRAGQSEPPSTHPR